LPISVSSLTQVGGTATANTSAPHGFEAGDFVIVAGATPADYNGEVQIALVDADTFTYPVSGNPSSPATGTITATFRSDASGGGTDGMRPFVTVSGHMHPLSADETLQAEAIQSITRYEAEIEYRPDITAKMQLQWTPFRHTTAKTLEVQGVKPHPKFPRKRLLIACGEAA
jgi:head-tail adaptor